MKFGPVPLEQALGAVLAHSANLRGGKLRKGKVLNADDLKRMVANGWQDVIVARLDADDVGEDAAATQLAKALIAKDANGLRLTKAATGRVNLHATAAGVLVFDAETVAQVNLVNPMISLATIPPLRRVAAGDMVATIKIIAYGVPAGDLVKAVAVAQGVIVLARPQVRTATLVETTVDGQTPPDKGRAALAGRLDRFGIALTGRVVTAHETQAITQAIAAAPGEMIFILTASATSDPYDVAPNAVRQTGGTITRFGMPVDPGNLLFLGGVGRKPVVGLPGCARSPALNGADWVLERVICGVPVTSDDIARMGVGGLLKEIPTRPQPRALNSQD